MKKFNVIRRAAITIIAALTMSVAANAQEQGDFAVGANLSVGMGDDITNFGLGPKIQYNILKPLRAEGSFTYFLPKDELSMWDASLNLHYLIPVKENLAVYPIVGVGLLGMKEKWEDEELYDEGLDDEGSGSESYSEAGCNLGGGIDLKLTDKLIFTGEVKYRIGNGWNRLILSAGVTYRF
ncbi:MAG: porin family protein [Prevotellaceae bacterium]|jgi:outer membrane protein X|nr:porin family protein [Prevotellaceae bacterium]